MMKYLLTNESTQRLDFRLLEKSDFQDFLPLFDTKEAQVFLALEKGKTAKELCQMWFDKVFDRYQNDLGGMNVLIEKSTGKMVGQCGLLIQTVEGETRMEIGYSMLPVFWGQGYASEAARKCRDFAFENNFWDALISIVHIDNTGSQKVAERNGMSIEKRLEDYKGMPVNINKITKDEWERRCKQ